MFVAFCLMEMWPRVCYSLIFNRVSVKLCGGYGLEKWMIYLMAGRDYRLCANAHGEIHSKVS